MSMNKTEIQGVQTSNQELSKDELKQINKRINEIDLRLNQMYFQNGQDINQGGLGDGNDDEIARLNSEKEAHYSRKGQMSPEEAMKSRQEMIKRVFAQDEAYRNPSISEDGEM